jgi:hypothetical protein
MVAIGTVGELTLPVALVTANFLVPKWCVWFTLFYAIKAVLFNKKTY